MPTIHAGFARCGAYDLPKIFLFFNKLGVLIDPL